MQDGVHELYVYKVDDRTRLDPTLYLRLAANLRDLEHGYKFEYNPIFPCSHKETLYVHTSLCSTKLTQNGRYKRSRVIGRADIFVRLLIGTNYLPVAADLLYLLQWRDHPDLIQEALTRALRLNGEELVKFLQDILDALFSMFSTEDGNSTAHSGLVFHVLVSIAPNTRSRANDGRGFYR